MKYSVRGSPSFSIFRKTSSTSLLLGGNIFSELIRNDDNFQVVLLSASIFALLINKERAKAIKRVIFS